jgi:hypothetical protein
MRLPPFAVHQGARRGLIAGLVLIALASIGCDRNRREAAPAASQKNAPQMAKTVCQDGGSSQAARDFYAKIMADAPSGLPSVESMQTLAPLMTSSLGAAIEKARIRQRAFIAAHPDLKPPFIEGSLFTSVYEGPTGVESAAATPRGDSVWVAMGFVYQEPGAESSRWKDQVLLLCEQGLWRVDDVRYDWDSASKNLLKQALESE